MEDVSKGDSNVTLKHIARNRVFTVTPKRFLRRHPTVSGTIKVNFFETQLFQQQQLRAAFVLRNSSSLVSDSSSSLLNFFFMKRRNIVLSNKFFFIKK